MESRTRRAVVPTDPTTPIFGGVRVVQAVAREMRHGKTTTKSRLWRSIARKTFDDICAANEERWTALRDRCAKCDGPWLSAVDCATVQCMYMYITFGKERIASEGATSMRKLTVVSHGSLSHEDDERITVRPNLWYRWQAKRTKQTPINLRKKVNNIYANFI
jgi:hypothetical protein